MIDQESGSRLQQVSLRRLTSVMAVDVCGYTAMTETNETRAIRLVQDVRAIIDQTAAKFGGRRFHKAADGFLLEFSSPRGALNAATEIQKLIVDRWSPSSDPRVRVRIGLHIGEVFDQDDGDILGHGVNVAARLQAEAAEGGILISSNFLNLVRDDFSGKIRRRGNLALRNISEPVEAFDIEPDTGSLGRLVVQVSRTLKQNRLVFGLFGALLAIVLVLFWTTPDDRTSSEAAISARVDAILETSFSTSEAGAAESTIDAAYMRGVLRRLGESRQASDKASFAMLEEGNIAGAIDSLEGHLGKLAPGEPGYSDTLHQIGALSYQYAPRKAIATYQALLLVEPDDLQALIYLGRSESTLSNFSEANRLFERALALPAIEAETALRLRLNIAFNVAAMSDNAQAEEMLAAIESEVMSTENARLISGFHTERGIVLERLDRVDAAEANLLAAANIQQRYGYDHDLERVYNVLGFIAQKRADHDPSQSAAYLSLALSYFEKQYQTAARIDKQRAIAAALYFQGDISLQLQDLTRAEKTFLDAFRVSSEHSFSTYEFLSRLGLAELAIAKGQQDQACEHIQKAESLYASRGEFGIGPRTTAKIRGTGCPFRFID